MALLLTPTAQNVFYTSFGLPVPGLYCSIAHLGYDKAGQVVTCELQYFVSQEAAHATPPLEAFRPLGLPTTFTCPDALDVLANADGKTAYQVAYEYAAACLARALGDRALIENTA